MKVLVSGDYILRESDVQLLHGANWFNDVILNYSICNIVQSFGFGDQVLFIDSAVRFPFDIYMNKPYMLYFIF